MSQTEASLEAHLPARLASVASPFCSLHLSPIVASNILGYFLLLREN